jgi:hypothetical protein
VKTSVFTATLCVGALATSAFAADVSINGSVNQTLEASDNYFLNTNPSGVTAKSTTGGRLDFLARTPTTSYLLDTNFSYFKYFGPGADQTSPTWGTPASANFTINHLTELDRYNFAASWSRSDAAVTQLTQSGIATARGSINTYNINGGVTHDLGRNDTISLSAVASSVSFSDPTQTPYKDVSPTIFWNHNVSQTTTWTNSVNFDWFSQDNAANSQRLMWRFTSGVQSQLSPRLSVHGDIGWVFANAYENGAASTTTTFIPGVTPFQPLVGAGNGWFGDVGLSYRLLKDTSVSLTAAHAIIPLFTGQLQLSETLGAMLSHEINQSSSWSVFTSYAQSTTPGQVGQSGGGASDFFAAGINYNYRLSREWRTNMSYTFRENVGQAKSSTILFSLARDFTLMGNPTAINEADRERGRQRARDSIGQVFPTFQ